MQKHTSKRKNKKKPRSHKKRKENNELFVYLTEIGQNVRVQCDFCLPMLVDL